MGGRLPGKRRRPPLWPWMQVLRHLGGPRITAGAAEGAAARYRLYERIGYTLRERAEAKPHLVVIDDLHRADEASIRLLAYLSETLWPASIGMVVTNRDTETRESRQAPRFKSPGSEPPDQNPRITGCAW